MEIRKILLVLRKKEKAGDRPLVFFWSSLRESNPYNQLGKLVFYH